MASEEEEVEGGKEKQPLKRTFSMRSPRKGWTFWLGFTAVVCFAGSSLQCGYNLSVINAPEDVIKDYFNKHNSSFSDFKWAVTVALFAVGGMFGALVGPILANMWGRKWCLWLNNFLAIIAGSMMFTSYFVKSPVLLILGRVIVGLNSGINTTVAPLYLSEISPINLRGSLGTLNQFGIVTGILLAEVLGLKEVLGTSTRWPYLLGFTIAPGLLQLIALLFCPRSPRYLLLTLNDEPRALAALFRLRGSTNVDDDIQEMRIEQENENGVDKVSVFQLFRRSDLTMPLLISCILQMSQQFSGINGVLYYSTSVFKKVGIKQSDVATCGVGVVSVITTGIVVKLVEAKGRRTLMLWGLGGMCVFYIMMTVSFVELDRVHWMPYVSVVATLILVLFFMLGPGAIPWFITAELFAQNSRDAAVAVAGTVNWMSNFAVGLIFPSMQKALYPYTFVPFIILVALFWIFTFIWVPETKGRSIEQITDGFRTGEYSTLGYESVPSSNQE